MSKRKFTRSGNIIFKRDPSLSKCPSCGDVFTLRRSKARNFFEQVIRTATFFKTYRCNKCGWRGHKSTLIFTWTSLKNLAIYSAIALITAYAARKIIETMIR